MAGDVTAHNDRLVESIADDVRDAVADAVRETAETMAADARQRVGVPGTRANRSKSGEPPRKQSGRLQESIGADVTTGGDAVRGSVYADVFYAEILERGLNRPVLRGVAEDHEDALLDGIASRIESTNPER